MSFMTAITAGHPEERVPAYESHAFDHVESHIFEHVDQLALFRARSDGIDSAFWAFHKNNPHVYAELVRLARRAHERGFKKIGIKHLFEVARWEIAMRTNDPTQLKLNNNLTSRYARLIAQQEPDLADLFETRELKTQSSL